jgi:hypothetical protein
MIPPSGATDYVKFSTLHDEIFIASDSLRFGTEAHFKVPNDSQNARALAKPGLFP